ncbi:hypothetical protein R6Q59_021279 [Mikania micrantha]
MMKSCPTLMTKKKTNRTGMIGPLMEKKGKMMIQNCSVYSVILNSIQVIQSLSHCFSSHSFDFGSIKTTLNLDFYGCFKLINYVRSQVAANRCWSCGSICESRQELLDHLHEPSGFGSSNLPWD